MGVAVASTRRCRWRCEDPPGHGMVLESAKAQEKVPYPLHDRGQQREDDGHQTATENAIVSITGTVVVAGKTGVRSIRTATRANKPAAAHTPESARCASAALGGAADVWHRCDAGVRVVRSWPPRMARYPAAGRTERSHVRRRGQRLREAAGTAEASRTSLSAAEVSADARPPTTRP